MDTGPSTASRISPQEKKGLVENFFFVPQLYLWGSPLLAEICAYVTVFF